MFRITARWTGLPGGDAVNVFHFAGNGQDAAQDAASALNQVYLLNALGFTDTAAVEVDELVAEIDITTGVASAFWPVVTTPVEGGATEDPLPQNAMLLLKYSTDGVVAGRRVQGKTFLPGLTTAALLNGEVLPAFRTDFGVRFTNLIAAGLVVYSRPIDGGRPGSQHPVTGVTVWNEWAQLGRRRS